MEVSEAYVVVYLPRTSVSTHQFHVHMCNQAIGCPNIWNGYNLDGLLDGRPGNDHDE